MSGLPPIIPDLPPRFAFARALRRLAAAVRGW
jgi:hypothetical protein